MTAKPLWTPSPERIASHRLSRFIGMVNERHGLELSGYDGIHRYSVERAPEFWADVWDFCGVIAETRGDRLVVDQDRMPGARFFPDAVLNFAENLLRRNDDTPALVFRGEDKVRKTVTWSELNQAVSRIHHGFAALGLEVVPSQANFYLIRFDEGSGRSGTASWT